MLFVGIALETISKECASQEYSGLHLSKLKVSRVTRISINFWSRPIEHWLCKNTHHSWNRCTPDLALNPVQRWRNQGRGSNLAHSGYRYSRKEWFATFYWEDQVRIKAQHSWAILRHFQPNQWESEISVPISYTDWIGYLCIQHHRR